MAGYDPKRPRPGASEDLDGPAPVEALLDPAAARPPGPRARRSPSDEPAPTDRPDPGPGGSAAADDEVPETTPLADVAEVDLREPAAPVVGRAATPGSAMTESPVPVAPAPEEGTANRAVLVVGAVVAGVLVAVLAVLLGRRRRRD